MNLLYLTFYFEPDLGPGAFRNTALVNELCRQLPEGSHIHVITTLPNRYQSYKPRAAEHEEQLNGNCRITIDRVAVPTHNSGQLGQARAFTTYFWAVHRLTKEGKYASVFASSSRLFTAYLGAKLARSRHIPLYLDIRDLFREAIGDVYKSRWYVGFVVQSLLNVPLWFVERYAFSYARNINLVSEGFRSYFRAYRQATYSYFTNGIDEEFLNLVSLSEKTFPGSAKPPEVKTILYAGNVGEGQGLHKIIPQAARQLGAQYRFVVVGCGGAKRKLKAVLRAQKITNVELYEPVSRRELMAYYQQADYLFLHLNNLKACRRVLPSKLFEYGATGKPILAGVTGFSAQFIRAHLPDTILFESGDVRALVKQLRRRPYCTEDRVDFNARFRRSAISQQMAQQIRQSLVMTLNEPIADGCTKFSDESDHALFVDKKMANASMK